MLLGCLLRAKNCAPVRAPWLPSSCKKLCSSSCSVAAFFVQKIVLCFHFWVLLAWFRYSWVHSQKQKKVENLSFIIVLIRVTYPLEPQVLRPSMASPTEWYPDSQPPTDDPYWTTDDPYWTTCFPTGVQAGLFAPNSLLFAGKGWATVACLLSFWAGPPGSSHRAGFWARRGGHHAASRAEPGRLHAWTFGCVSRALCQAVGEAVPGIWECQVVCRDLVFRLRLRRGCAEGTAKTCFYTTSQDSMQYALQLARSF